MNKITRGEICMATGYVFFEEGVTLFFKDKAPLRFYNDGSVEKLTVSSCSGYTNPEQLETAVADAISYLGL